MNSLKEAKSIMMVKYVFLIHKTYNQLYVQGKFIFKFWKESTK